MFFEEPLGDRELFPLFFPCVSLRCRLSLVFFMSYKRLNPSFKNFIAIPEKTKSGEIKNNILMKSFNLKHL